MPSAAPAGSSGGRAFRPCSTSSPEWRRSASRPASSAAGSPSRRERPHGRATTALAERLRRPSAATAAAAGVATHVPGLIYFVALNSIAAERPSPAETVVQVGLYNLLWFAIPLASLVLAIRSPGTARVYLDRATALARRHQERLLVLTFGALGAYLVVNGLAHLI